MEEIPVIDPHFHVWDVTNYDQTGHARCHLAGPAQSFPTYFEEDYLEDMNSIVNVVSPSNSWNFKFKAGVFVEALSDSPVKEAQWVVQNTKSFSCPSIVGYAYLSDPNVEDTLRGLAEIPKVVGVRQIVNHHPTDTTLIWPKVYRPDYLTNSSFKRGYSLLQKYNFSFDLHANPHQLKDAAALFHDHPSVPVVIDHLGCLKLSDDAKENERCLKVWREGMQALAALPHTSLKLSCLTFTKKGWEQPLVFNPEENEEENNNHNNLNSNNVHNTPYKQVKSLVLEMISLFSSERCMFATNFPVDKHGGVSARQMYQTFSDWTKDLSATDRKNLFHDTAARVYRMELNN